MLFQYVLYWVYWCIYNYSQMRSTVSQQWQIGCRSRWEFKELSGIGGTKPDQKGTRVDYKLLDNEWRPVVSPDNTGQQLPDGNTWDHYTHSFFRCVPGNQQEGLAPSAEHSTTVNKHHTPTASYQMIWPFNNWPFYKPQVNIDCMDDV